jgi:hypothetical protein
MRREGLVLQSSTWSWRIAEASGSQRELPSARPADRLLRQGTHTSIPRPAWRSGTYGGQQLGMRCVSPGRPAMERGEPPETLAKRTAPNMSLADCSLWLAACSL